jgi:hypothetical protein
MSKTHQTTGILTIAHSELWMGVDAPVPGHLSMGAPVGVAVPLPGGLANGRTFGMPRPELRSYLDHGMVLSGDLVLEETDNGLTLIGAAGLRAITDHDRDAAGFATPEERMRIDGILTAAEQLGGYREARLRAGVEVSIADWQGDDRADKTTPDEIRLTIQSEAYRLLLTTKDGRKLDLELQDGTLRAMAYENDDGKETPVITSLPREGGILTERQDYDREVRREPDDLEP